MRHERLTMNNFPVTGAMCEMGKFVETMAFQENVNMFISPLWATTLKKCGGEDEKHEHQFSKSTE